MKKHNLPSSQKLLLVGTFCLIEDRIIHSLKNLNKLRNRCTHDLSVNICYSDIERIGTPLGKTFTTLKRNHIEDQKRLFSSILGFITAFLTGAVQSIEQKHHNEIEKKRRLFLDHFRQIISSTKWKFRNNILITLL